MTPITQLGVGLTCYTCCKGAGSNWRITDRMQEGICTHITVDGFGRMQLFRQSEHGQWVITPESDCKTAVFQTKTHKTSSWAHLDDLLKITEVNVGAWMNMWICLSNQGHTFGILMRSNTGEKHNRHMLVNVSHKFHMVSFQGRFQTVLSLRFIVDDNFTKKGKPCVDQQDSVPTSVHPWVPRSVETATLNWKVLGPVATIQNPGLWKPFQNPILKPTRGSTLLKNPYAQTHAQTQSTCSMLEPQSWVLQSSQGFILHLEGMQSVCFPGIWPDPTMLFEKTSPDPKVYILPGKMYTFDFGIPISSLESWNFLPKFQKVYILPGKMYTLDFGTPISSLESWNFISKFQKVYILGGKMYTFDSGTPISSLESWNFISKFQKVYILGGKMYTFDSGTPISSLESWNFISKFQKVYILLGKMYPFDSGTVISGLESWNFMSKCQKVYILLGKMYTFDSGTPISSLESWNFIRKF